MKEEVRYRGGEATVQMKRSLRRDCQALCLLRSANTAAGGADEIINGFVSVLGMCFARLWACVFTSWNGSTAGKE